VSDIRDEVAESFAELFGYMPSGIWSAPGRVNLLGDEADADLGSALSFAIDRRTFVALGLRSDSLARIASTVAGEVIEIDVADLGAADLGPAQLEGWSANPLGVIAALGQLGADLDAVPGVDILIDADVPEGAGLSSSTATLTAMAIAMNDVWRLELDSLELSKVAQLATSVATGAATGITAAITSLGGQPDSAVLLDHRTSQSRRVQLGIAASDVAVVLIDTGASKIQGPGTTEHLASEHQRVIDAVAALEDAAEGGASQRSALRSLGELLSASHRSFREDRGIFIAEVELAVDIALENGALGARMTGAGSVIALVARDDVSRVQVAMDGAFSEHALSVPDTFVVTPSAGARRER
jgi:galactokinase